MMEDEPGCCSRATARIAGDLSFGVNDGALYDSGVFMIMSHCTHEIGWLARSLETGDGPAPDSTGLKSLHAC